MQSAEPSRPKYMFSESLSNFYQFNKFTKGEG